MALKADATKIRPAGGWPVLGLVVAILTTMTLGQNSPGTNSAAQAPKFSARTELVLVPVVVTDKSGSHIPNLKQQDFMLLENGREQKIAFFEEVKTSNAQVRRTASPPEQRVFSNQLQGTDNPKRLTMIVLDTINTPALNQSQARGQLIKYLSTAVPAGEPISY